MTELQQKVEEAHKRVCDIYEDVKDEPGESFEQAHSRLLEEKKDILDEAKKRYRRLSKPICPNCHIECLCESTKEMAGTDFKIQYRYCPVCRHPEQKVIPK